MTRDLQQQRDNNADSKSAADVDVDAEHKPEVSRKSSNAGLRREVQMKGQGVADPAQVHEAAQRGTATAGAAMPHQEKIQAAFGDHDISGVRAHVDPSSSRAMGAEAYATGNHVVFGQQPDLHTAAHEAAHVVQQKQGVSLSGGVGAEGDTHEKRADAVADRVVAGKSAADLLGPAPGAGGAQGQAVQKKPAAKAVDPKAAHDASDRKSYDSAHSALVYFAKELHTWGPEAQKLADSDGSGEAGTAPAEQAIMAIYQQALNEAAHIGELIYTTNKSERSTLSPDVKLVQGAYTRFWAKMQGPVNWMAKKKENLDLSAIQKEIDGYTAKIGLEGTELTPDVAVPDGEEKSLSKSMVGDQFTALEAALASVKSGNEADVSRITMHLRYIHGISKEHPAEIKSHKAQLKTYFKELVAIEKDQPKLADALAEGHNHLLSLLK